MNHKLTLLDDIATLSGMLSCPERNKRKSLDPPSLG